MNSKKNKEIGGYVGKILWVDLDTKQTRTLSTYDYLDGIGGNFMSYYLQWQFGKPGIKNGLDPESLLMFITGPLTGSPVPGSARMTVAYQQTMQDPSYWSQSSVAGGGFGPELKFAGYDALIVRGKSEKPVYLSIKDDEIEFRDAESFFYRDTYFAHDQVVSELGGDKRIRTAVIGPAGANLNALSVIMFDTSHAAAQHPGSVMGAKNLKAVAVRGTGSIKIADPDYIKKNRVEHQYMSDDLSWDSVGGKGHRQIQMNQTLLGGMCKREYNCYGCYSCRMAFIDHPSQPKGGNLCGFTIEYSAAHGLGAGLLKFEQNDFGDSWTDPPRYTLIGKTYKETMAIAKLFDLYGISGYELMGMRTPLNLLNVMCFSEHVTPAFRTWLEGEVGAAYGTWRFGEEYLRKVAHREGLVGEWMAKGVENAAKMLRDHPEKFGITTEDGKYAWDAYQRAYPIHGSFEHHFNRPTNADPRDNPKTVRLSPVSCGIYGLGSRQMGKSSHCATEIYDESQRNSRAMAYAVYGDERAACRYLDEDDNPVLYHQPYMADNETFYTLDGRASKPVKPNFTKGSPLAILHGTAFSFYNDCLGTCDWLWPVLYGNTCAVLFAAATPKTRDMVDYFERPEKVSHPEWSPGVFTAVTGIPKTLEEFYYDAFRAMTVERAIHVRDSDRQRENDKPNLLTVLRKDASGIQIANDDYAEWKKGFALVYEMLGWDPETGVPTREGLHRFGLDEIAEELAAVGRLSEFKPDPDLRVRLLAEGRAETEKNSAYYAQVWNAYVQARDEADAAGAGAKDLSTANVLRNVVDESTAAAVVGPSD